MAALLKQAGDAVEEDEAIAQIETDKVTLDVRAPKAGRLESYKVSYWAAEATASSMAVHVHPVSSSRMAQVKEGDTVTVGQAVAVIAAGEGAWHGRLCMLTLHEALALISSCAGASTSQAKDDVTPDTKPKESKQDSGEAQQAQQQASLQAPQQQQQPSQRQEAESHGRKPGITFPRRRTNEGVRISTLSPAEQQQCAPGWPAAGCVTSEQVQHQSAVHAV